MWFSLHRLIKALSEWADRAWAQQLEAELLAALQSRGRDVVAVRAPDRSGHSPRSMTSIRLDLLPGGIDLRELLPHRLEVESLHRGFLVTLHRPWPTVPALPLLRASYIGSERPNGAGVAQWAVDGLKRSTKQALEALDSALHAHGVPITRDWTLSHDGRESLPAGGGYQADAEVMWYTVGRDCYFGVGGPPEGGRAVWLILERHGYRSIREVDPMRASIRALAGWIAAWINDEPMLWVCCRKPSNGTLLRWGRWYPAAPFDPERMRVVTDEAEVVVMGNDLHIRDAAPDHAMLLEVGEGASREWRPVCPRGHWGGDRRGLSFEPFECRECQATYAVSVDPNPARFPIGFAKLGEAGG